MHRMPESDSGRKRNRIEKAPSEGPFILMNGEERGKSVMGTLAGLERPPLQSPQQRRNESIPHMRGLLDEQKDQAALMAEAELLNPRPSGARFFNVPANAKESSGEK